MIINKVSYYSKTNGSYGFSYHKSKKIAKSHLMGFKNSCVDDYDDEKSGIDIICVNNTLSDIIILLNVHASHPNTMK